MIIAIGGEPASGKTTLVKSVLRNLGQGRKFKFKKLRGIYYNSKRTFVLGVYDESLFSGTDKLSMAVQPDVEEFVKSTMRKDRSYKIMFEGDRLFNLSFLSMCQQWGLKAFVIKCSDEQKKLRHLTRGDDQSDSFLRSRATKVKNIQAKIDCKEVINETEENRSQFVAEILRIIGGNHGV
jgi:dephospho-CoA kinase